MKRFINIPKFYLYLAVFGILLALSITLTVPKAFAAEQRCGELGSNCVCSEPLNTNSIVWNSGTGNPNDSTPATKECSAIGQGGTIYRGNEDLTGTNDPTILGALPAG